MMRFIDSLLGNVTGELRDECRQELAVQLLSKQIRKDQLTPALAAKFVRRVQRSLGDRYKFLSLSGETGEALESRLGLR